MNVTIPVLAFIAKLLSGATVRWIDSHPDTCQRVYFANHTSHLDALVLWSSLPRHVRELTRPVAAKDYWEKGPIRRYMARLFNAILIDRQEIKVHQSPVDAMITEIGTRYSLIVFPEGGRSGGQDLGGFQERTVLSSEETPRSRIGARLYRQPESGSAAWRVPAGPVAQLHHDRAADLPGTQGAEDPILNTRPRRCSQPQRPVTSPAY